MTKSARNMSPVVRFLGDDAGRGGPFAILGLGHTIESPEMINRARSRRLRQIDCHPHRATPDADEVRLAVHSAATQLLDPDLREQLIRRWPEGTPVDVPKAWRAGGAIQRLTPRFMHRARLIVGSSGGWNPIARRRLAHLARLNRVSALEVVRALGRGSRGGSDSKARRPSTPVQLPDPPGGNGGWIGAYALLGLLLCTLLITIAFDPASRDVQDTVSGQRVTQTESPGSTGRLPTESTVIQERERLSHYTAIAHELDRLVARAQLDPQASIERFRVIYPLFIEQWTSFPHQALERAQLNIIEYTLRLERRGIPPEQLASMFAVGGTDPDRLMIGAATIDVLLATNDLGIETQTHLLALRRRIDPSPSVEQEQVLGVIVGIASEQAHARRDDAPSWWESWLRGTLYTTNDDSRARTRLLIEAIGARLRDPSDPDREWFASASMLVGELEWRAESAERYWLLSQFNDQRVSTARLAILTEALIASSAASGIDARMVLERDANDPARQQLALAYRQAWFPARSTNDAAANRSGGNDDLLSMLKVSISSVSLNASEDQRIDQILELASLSSAAVFNARGDDAMSTELMLNSPQLADMSPRDPAVIALEAADNQWAEQAINCETPAQLLPLLNELIANNEIGINSAHALVRIATLRPESEMRELARARLVRARSQLSVLIAIDHALTSTRVSSRLDQLVGEVLAIPLPDRNDQRWFLAARRGVLGKMGEALGAPAYPRRSALPGVLAEIISMQMTDAQLAQLGDNPQPDRVLSVLNLQARIELESSMPESSMMRSRLLRLDALAQVRSARAQSSMDRYLAQLHNAYELHALSIDLRIPGVTQRLDDIRIDLAQRERGAGSLLDQVLLAHRAIAQLWELELERGGRQ